MPRPSLIAVKPATTRPPKSVRRANAGVDDVRADAGTGGVEGIGCVERQVPLIDAVESPCGAGLSCAQTDNGIFFDEGDTRIISQPRRLFLRHAHGKTFERTVVSVGLIAIAAENAREASSFAFDVFNVVFEHHDVLIRNSFLRACGGTAMNCCRFVREPR